MAIFVHSLLRPAAKDLCPDKAATGKEGSRGVFRPTHEFSNFMLSKTIHEQSHSNISLWGGFHAGGYFSTAAQFCRTAAWPFPSEMADRAAIHPRGLPRQRLRRTRMRRDRPLAESSP
jgi:hypothetical protein